MPLPPDRKRNVFLLLPFLLLLCFSDVLHSQQAVSEAAARFLGKSGGRSIMPIKAGEEVFSQYLPGENVRIFGCSDEDIWKVSLFVRSCFAEVQNATGAKDSPRRELQFLLPEVPDGQLPFVTFNLNEYAADEVPLALSWNYEHLAWEIMRSLLWRRMNDLLGSKRRLAPQRSAAVDFMAAALCNRILYDNKGGSGGYLRDFRMAQVQFKRGIFPRVELLLEKPVFPEYPLLFRIYAMHCDLLLFCIERSQIPKLQFLERFWRLAQETKQGGAVQAMAKALEIPAEEPWHLQNWYEKQAFVGSKSGLQSHDQEDIARRLEKALVIPVISAESRDAIREIPLEEVPELIQTYKLDLNAVTELQQRFLVFRYSAPPLLRPALDEFNAAMELLRKRDDGGFRKALANARKSFQKAMENQRQAEQMLDEAEQMISRGDDARSFEISNWLLVQNFLERLQDYVPMKDVANPLKDPKREK